MITSLCPRSSAVLHKVVARAVEDLQPTRAYLVVQFLVRVQRKYRAVAAELVGLPPPGTTEHLLGCRQMEIQIYYKMRLAHTTNQTNVSYSRQAMHVYGRER